MCFYIVIILLIDSYKILSIYRDLISLISLLFSFFESPSLIHESRQKGLFDSNMKFCKELACGLRSVRKELMNIHPQPIHSQELIEYVIFEIFYITIYKYIYIIMIVYFYFRVKRTRTDFIVKYNLSI